MNDFDGASRRPKTSELEILVAIAASGSLSGAAAHLGCTQSRISHALGELEGVVGQRLFQRSRTGTHPTDAGVVAIEQARRALQLLDQLTTSPADAALLGVVRVAAYRSVATHVLTPAALAVTAKHRGVRVEVDDACDDKTSVERSLRDGHADIGIVHTPHSAGFITTPFARDDYVAVTHVACRPRPGAFWRDLAQMPLFELRCSGAHAAVEACRRDGMTNRTSGTFSSDSTILAHVVQRRGVAILPRLAIEPLGSDLVAVPLPIEAIRMLVMIRRRARSNRAIRTVAAELAAFVRRAPLPFLRT
jgi:DNA-binding transcriptional LysR family regulator